MTTIGLLISIMWLLCHCWFIHHLSVSDICHKLLGYSRRNINLCSKREVVPNRCIHELFRFCKLSQILEFCRYLCFASATLKKTTSPQDLRLGSPLVVLEVTGWRGRTQEREESTLTAFIPVQCNQVPLTKMATMPPRVFCSHHSCSPDCGTKRDLSEAAVYSSFYRVLSCLTKAKFCHPAHPDQTLCIILMFYNIPLTVPTVWEASTQYR